MAEVGGVPVGALPVDGVLGPGLGICSGLVALPHARRRLDLADRIRVQMLARRFPSAVCAALDANTHLRFDGREWVAIRPTQCLTATGDIAAIGVTEVSP